MQMNCATCGNPFEAKRKTRKFCSDHCRIRSHRAPKLQVVPDAPADPTALPDDPPPRARHVLPSAYDATLKQLDAAGRLDTALGVSALIAAQMLDDSLISIDTGSSRAALIKAHREALAEAIKDAKTAADPLDMIRAAAALKLVQGGRS